MHIVSFIINGKSLTHSDITKLQQIAESERSAGSEYLLYAPEDTSLHASSRLVKVVSPGHRGITAVEKAIATSCGDRLVFTTLHNVLADSRFIMLREAGMMDHGDLALPCAPSYLQQISGIRLVKRVPYIIAHKRFASVNAKIFISPALSIKRANHLLSLVRIGLPSEDFPDPLIKHVVVSRSYGSIFRHKYGQLSHAIHAYFQRRKAEKLRRRVQHVAFSTAIPVFIICRDRVEPLKRLVKWCEDEGLTNIILIDNASTYPPLLNYYESTPHEVIQLSSNAGHTAPWDKGIVDVYAKGKPFIVTDPDVIPSDDGHGAIKLFCKLLNEYPERTKVGFGLKIDDLPNSYDLKDYVISWEKQFWVSSVEKNVYDAEIDTTFALYRHNTPYTLGPGLRTGGRYVAKHEPWYIDSKNITEEMRYYREHADRAVGSWGVNADELSETYSNHKNRQAL